MFRYLLPEMPIGKYWATLVGVVCSYFAPVKVLIFIALEFIAVDFVIGVVASRVRYKRAGRLKEWGFESQKAWRTVWKATFTVVGIVMAHHIDNYVFDFVDLYLTNMFCGFVCSTEFWSFLENAACISDHPVFRWLKKYMGSKVKDSLSIDPTLLEKAANREEPDKEAKDNADKVNC